MARKEDHEEDRMGRAAGAVPVIRRRADRFKRDIYSLTERQVKQNDQIIELLKEIRDRLPHK